MRYWVLSAVLLATYLVQAVASPFLTIREITPNLLLVIVLSYGLLFGWRVGLGAGVAAGVLMDVAAGLYVGLHVLSLGVVGLLAGLVEEKVFKDNPLLGPVGGLVGSIVAQTLKMACLWMFGWHVPILSTMRSTILPGALYDMCIMVFVYRWIYKYYLYLKPNPRGTIVLRR